MGMIKAKKKDTWQILEFVNQNAPQNYALKAYVLGKTWGTLPYNDRYEKITAQFDSNFASAKEAQDQTAKEVCQIMLVHFQDNSNPVELAARANRTKALSFFVACKEPLEAIHLFLAVLEEHKESFDILLEAGCPTQDNKRFIEPLVQALKDRQEEFVKKLMTCVDLTVPYQYDYPKKATIKEYFEKEYNDDAESLAAYYRALGYSKFPFFKPNYSVQRTLLEKYESWFAS